MKKTANVLVRLLLGILAFVLCVALFASAVLTVVMANIRVVTDKDNLNTLITGYLSGVSAPYRPRAGLPLTGGEHLAPKKNLNDEMSDISTMPDGNMLVEWIYGMLEEQSGGELGISLKEVQDFVDQSTLKDFVAEKTASLVSDLITGENTTTITVEEIQQQLELNVELIENTFGLALDKQIIEEIVHTPEFVEVVEQIGKGGLEAILNMTSPDNGSADSGNTDEENFGADKMENGAGAKPTKKLAPLLTTFTGLVNGELDVSSMSVPQLLNLFRSVVSLETLLLCIGLCAVLMGLVFLTQWKRYYSAMIKIGITLLVAGLLCMVPAVAVWSAPDLINTLLGEEMQMFAKLIPMVVSMTWQVPAGIAVGGLALIVAGGILRGMVKKRATAAALTQELSEQLCAEEAVEEVEEVAEESTEEEAQEAAEEAAEV